MTGQNLKRNRISKSQLTQCSTHSSNKTPIQLKVDLPTGTIV